MDRTSTRGYDVEVYSAFKRACRRGPFGNWLIEKIEFASMATREMCARYAEWNGYFHTARKLRTF